MNVGNRVLNPVDVAVGARLRMRRKECGLSQTTLATELKISFQQIQKYEKGTNRVGASRLATIAQILRVPVSYFFDTSPASDASAPQTVVDLVASFKRPDVFELNAAFVAISDPATRRAVIRLIKAVAEGNEKISP